MTPCYHHRPEKLEILLITTGICLSLVGSISGIAYVAFTQAQERQRLQEQAADLSRREQDWAQIEKARQHRDQQAYAACILTLNQISDDSIYKADRQLMAEECYPPLTAGWLTKAHELQVHGQYLEALEMAEQIQAGPHLIAAQNLMRELNRTLLHIAENCYLSGDVGGFEEAVQWASKVKPEHPLYDEAQARIHAWHLEWERNQKYWQLAQSALTKGNLNLARQAAEEISLHPFWIGHRGSLLGKIKSAEAR
jgi:hypothetical protein